MRMREAVCAFFSFGSGNRKGSGRFQRHGRQPLRGEEEEDLDTISKNTTELKTLGYTPIMKQRNGLFGRIIEIYSYIFEIQRLSALMHHLLCRHEI